MATLIYEVVGKWEREVWERDGFEELGAELDKATLWRGCWVHLPEIGSLGYCGLGMRLLRISTGVSVGWIWKVVRV